MQSASRLGSIAHLTVVGRPLPALLAASRQLKNVRRLTIVDGGGGWSPVDDWSRLFSALRRLQELTIRNSSSAAAAAAVLGSLRTLDLSGSGAVELDARSFWTLRGLEVLDVSGNSLSRLTAAANDSAACVDFDEVGGATSVSASDSTSGIRSTSGLNSTSDLADEGCRQSAPTSLRVFNASRNRIDFIDAGSFDRKSGRKLELLDLSFNRLSRLDNGTFVDLYSLRSLNLSHNAIADIELEAFAITSDGGQSSAADVGYQATGKQPEEQYYISLASCTQGWRNIQVSCSCSLPLLLLLLLYHY